jgi:4-azaleucine resistance transporter AzlC
MRATWRTVDRALIRDVAALAAAVGFVGVSFGAIATSGAVRLWAVVAMSVLVFAGGSQFVAVGLVTAGNPVAAVLAGLLLNARHLPFGMAIGDVLGRGPARLAGSHLMVDESVAFAMAQADPRRRRTAYWLTGAALFATWNVGAVLGALLGGAVGDPNTFGLDAAFPAGLFALLLPTLRTARQRDTTGSGRRAARSGRRAARSGPGQAASPRGEVTVAGGEVTAVRGEVTVAGAAEGTVGPDGAGSRSGDPAAPWVAGAGALIAVAATPLAPAGLPVLLALAALGLAFVVPARRAAATC